ncbi:MULTISPECIES: Ig-like domain-containing protein [Alteromonas]|uniref:Ig-like domain-containing protein n=1 Tax=Alteromonas stellipolaris TaxID=233316 RepID=A0AAW7YYJ1_9ALTE|nr:MULTISPECIES: Ig-like domain-containing protein [Alteromonas]AMJ89574.1 hypothetical protein AV940_03270 [Alteromonas sp. Mac2]ALM91891.1 Beta-agarase precursor [Alteromonas stellipolaris LMG 21856]AMJ73272.1 hypothetical protein AVL57_04355 [Alteromonas stellipolaris]AMJ85714.1 hypothetical protein AV939_03425 [Alteromonas sp. Mac1]ANB20065.1 hypothetical protein A6K25_01425 [Alteromonas stellipolaris]
MNYKLFSALLGVGLALSSPELIAKTEAVVNANIKHSVGGKDSFDRHKYITLHSTVSESDWDGEADKLKYLMEDLDVYFGRENGSAGWNFNQSAEDPLNPGYVDPTHLVNRGRFARETTYGINDASVHKYDGRGDVMVGGQPRPHWFATVNPCCGGQSWQANGADAVGDFMGQYMNAFFRTEGEPSTQGRVKPTYFEVLNEPLYQLTDAPHEMGLEAPIPPIDIFNFHKDVANAFRQHNQDIKIGGYTVAFPIYEERNFARWGERMKLFIDTAGESMDFYSTHFYDLEDDNRFKGSRIEATLDMMDHYSLLTLGKTKEHVISEYGGRNRPLENAPWTPLRDWWFLKTASPMMMQFMDRPDAISKAIPFVTVKALWGTRNGFPYNWRLLRQAKEGEGEQGEHWVFTEMVKFYELWSDVQGTRVDSFTTNEDILIDSYVSKEKLYVIFSNLTEDNETILLHQHGTSGAKVQNIKVKHLYLANNAPQLDIINAPLGLDHFELAPEATIVVEYSYDADLNINGLSTENKYFATEYLKEIDANQVNQFEIKGVQTTSLGESILRIALGRDHGQSLSPEVRFNGQLLTSNARISGDEQLGRDRFFGLLEIPVPYSLLKNDNQIDITFPDTGGHIASVNMKVFGFDQEIRPDGGAVTGMYISPDNATLAIGATLKLSASVTPFFASDQSFNLASSDESVAMVDSNGMVTALNVGDVTITATSRDGNFTATTKITVEEPTQTSISFDDVQKYETLEFHLDKNMQVTTEYDAGTGFEVTADLGGINYLLRHMASNWTVISDIKVTDSTAIGTQKGTSTVYIPLSGLTPSEDLTNGEFYFLFVRVRSSSGDTESVAAYPITIVPSEDTVKPSLALDDESKYLSSTYSNNGTLDVTAFFEAGEGQTVTDELGGVKFFLREMDQTWSRSFNDIVVSDPNAIGKQSGTAQVSLPLSGIPPTQALPEGHFYFLFAQFISTDGSTYKIQGIAPLNVVAPAALFGDWDGDADVDSADISGLLAAIQARQDVPPNFDINNDGLVNILDARAMMALCTRARCVKEETE